MGTSVSGRSVVVTGGAGFIGSHLAEELVRRGADVVVVDDLTKGQLRNLDAIADRIEVVRLDLRDEELGGLLAARKPAFVFHLAGFASAPDSVGEARLDFEQNAVATISLLEGLREHCSTARVVFASSAAVYGEGSDGTALSEDGPTVPLAPYGVSKLAAERYISVYANVYGLPAASLRLFPGYGPRLRRHVMWDLMSKLREDAGRLTLEGDGTQVRDFLYVANAIDAMLLVAETAPLEGEVYNVSDGRPVTIGELAALIAEAMELAPEIAHTGSVRPGVAHAWIADTARIRELGFRPRVDLEQGLARTVEWFRAESGRR
jgi:UDP-glucose 4-epimerase